LFLAGASIGGDIDLTVEDMEGTEPAEAPTGSSENGDAPTMTSQDEFPAGDPKDQRSTTAEPTQPESSVESQPAQTDEPADDTPMQGDGVQTDSAAVDGAGAVAAAVTTDDEAAPDGATDDAATTGDGVMASQLADMADSADDTADDNSAQTHAAMAADEFADAPPAVAEADSEPETAVAEGPEPTTMEELLREQSGEIRSLKHGDVVEGTVVRIDKDEILVDIGAKSEGVVSNRELYGRNAEVQPVLNIGDQVLVYVLQPESQEGHAVLSLRRAGLERKWRSMQEQLDAGAIIEAPVIDHNKGGLIVDCGIRGFVPISQIVDFPRRPQNEQPRDAAQEIAEKLQPYVGRKLRLKILEVNRKANRLILSEKVALYEERREKRDELFSSLQVGQKVTGTVRSIAPFGVFIDLGGIDGLVHKSELSWNKVNNPESGYHVGEEVEAEVIDINHERGRISLSVRRLQPDPWHSTVADFNVGDIIDGTVTKLVNFGAFVRVRDGLEGLIHISELSNQRVAHPGDVVHEGQQLKLRIISLDSERHRLGLSLKQAEEAAPARPAPEAVAEDTAAPAPGLPQPTRAPRAERERRPRSGERERSYSSSDAVQEPEGGIDTTLAAAFAGVREQLAKAEAAEAPEAEQETIEASAADTTEATADVVAPEAETAEAETLEAVVASEAEAPAAEATAAAAPETPAGETEAASPAPEATAETQPATEGAPPATEAVATEASAEPAADAADTTGATADTGKKARRSAKASEPEASDEATADDTAAEEPATPEATAAD
jgi:small subunit ribosomal protein S1